MYVRGSCSLLCYPRSSEPRLISDQKPAFSDDWTKPDSFLLESTSRQNGQTYPSSKHPPSESEDPAASFTLVNCMKAKSKIKIRKQRSPLYERKAAKYLEHARALLRSLEGNIKIIIGDAYYCSGLGRESPVRTGGGKAPS